MSTPQEQSQLVRDSLMVFGGTGYIGKVVCKTALATGYDVRSFGFIPSHLPPQTVLNNPPPTMH